jgi:hypothetical protein
MIIRLLRAFTLEEMHDEDCGICGLRFRIESVIAVAVTDGRIEMGPACPSCVEYLGQRNPECFPTIEEYEDALRRYSEPIWGTEEEADHALEVEDASVVLTAANWIIRV